MYTDDVCVCSRVRVMESASLFSLKFIRQKEMQLVVMHRDQKIFRPVDFPLVKNGGAERLSLLS